MRTASKVLHENIDMSRTVGNLILMTLICVVIFIAVMAVRPASAAELSRKMLGLWCVLNG
jgi:hypothetical protein